MSRARTIDPPRFIAAVVVGELVPLLALVLAVAVIGAGERGGPEAAAQRLGMWVGPLAGAATIFAMTIWAGRRSSRPVVQGLVVGFLLACIDVAILAATGAGFAWLFVASNSFKVLAGGLGGWFAGRFAGD